MATVDKFKDKEALENAYCALEKEFTRKCQRVKELEKQCEKSASHSDCNDSHPQDVVGFDAARTDNPYIGRAERNGAQAVGWDADRIAVFLQLLNQSGLVPSSDSYCTPNVMGSSQKGFMCLAPKHRPKNLKEASEMAESFLFRKQ